MDEALFRLHDIEVAVISLVNKGANKKRIIFKSQDLPDEPTLNRNIEIRKTVEDERMVYGIVYAPDEIDTDGHTASAEEIKKASENFMKAGRTTSIDKQHNYATDEGFVSENWITKEGDRQFPDDPVGSWAVGIKVEKDETWDAVKSGEITGISLAGMAVMEDLTKIENPILKWLKSKFESENSKEVQGMDKVELIKAISEDEEVQTAVAELVKTAVEEAVKPLSEKIGSLETANADLKSDMEKSNTELKAEVEKISKETPGPVSKEDQDEVDDEKVDEASFIFA